MLHYIQRVEALAILHLIATLVFEKRPADLRWTEWRFERMQDFLLENSIMYQKLVKLGELKGIEEGIEKGIETGRVEGKRESIESIVQMRFPALLDLAKERLKYIQDQESLQRLLVAMVAANTERQARRFLLALRDKSKE